jgi:uncharacterized protein YjaG (DUF416 family)
MVHSNSSEAELLKRLARLPNELRVAFAACCAERQMRRYEQFSDRRRDSSMKTLSQLALTAIWGDLQGKTIAESELKTMLELCMTLLPSEEEEQLDAGTPYAEDALASTIFALGARLTSDPNEALRAARRPCDAIDHFILANLNTSVVSRELQAAVEAHPLMQAELRRQRADLEELEALSNSKRSVSSVMDDLRNRAQRDAQTFLPD